MQIKHLNLIQFQITINAKQNSINRQQQQQQSGKESVNLPFVCCFHSIDS